MRNLKLVYNPPNTKLNKYQEALKLAVWLYDKHGGSFDFEEYGLFESLYELVDKATPKKAVWIEDFLRCPNCLNYDSLSDGYGEHHNYCNECGQALLWED